MDRRPATSSENCILSDLERVDSTDRITDFGWNLYSFTGDRDDRCRDTGGSSGEGGAAEQGIRRKDSAVCLVFVLLLLHTCLWSACESPLT